VIPHLMSDPRLAPREPMPSPDAGAAPAPEGADRRPKAAPRDEHDGPKGILDVRYGYAKSDLDERIDALKAELERLERLAGRRPTVRGWRSARRSARARPR